MCGWVWFVVLVLGDSVKTLNWAAILTAVFASVASVHFKITADSLEFKLQLAQEELNDTFLLASPCIVESEPL